MGLSWQEYWSGLPFSPPRDLPDSVIQSVSPEPLALSQANSLPLSHVGNPKKDFMKPWNPSEWQPTPLFSGFLATLVGGSEGKVLVCNAGDLLSIPELGRSPGEGNGNPLQYSWNPMDGRAQWATVHGVTELDLTEQHFLFFQQPYQVNKKGLSSYLGDLRREEFTQIYRYHR